MIKHKSILNIITALNAFIFTSCLLCQTDTISKPKLILQITVDQLRGDMPRSVYDRLEEGGFRYLYEKGIVYKNARHWHANHVHIDTLWGEKLVDQTMLDRAAFIKKEYIDKGKMGMSSGEGFYKYPNPKYADPDFLK